PRAHPDAITLPRVLMTGAGFLPVSAETVVTGYLAHHGLACLRTGTPQGATLSAELADGDTVTVDIDTHDRIARVGVTAAPRTVPSRAWWLAAGAGLAQVLEQDGEFTAFIEANPYSNHDLAAKVLHCGSFGIRIRVLGSLDASGTRWVWDPDTHAHLSRLPALANAPETGPEIDLSACPDPTAAVKLLSHGAAGLLAGGCCVDLPDDDGRAVYVTVDDPRVPRATAATAMAEALRGAAEVVTALVSEPQRAAVITRLTEEYLAAHGSATREDTAEGTVFRAEKLTVTVDGSGATRVDANGT
ncbi:MAG TPA: hypothetical protein VLH10_11195, partial [Yinghuangia sp.]|nr:hypothetical protein [Yinghuangia sp.]